MRVIRMAEGMMALAVLLTGCVTGRSAPPAHQLPVADAEHGADGAHERSPTSNGIVFTEAQLAEAQSPLLDLLRRRMAGLQVQTTPTCPEVMLRGRSTVSTSSSPAIYVEGMQASNTCILQDMNTADMARVEVYPSGVPGRPGYRVHPYGVILIFVRHP